MVKKAAKKAVKVKAKKSPAKKVAKKLAAKSSAKAAKKSTKLKTVKKAQKVAKKVSAKAAQAVTKTAKNVQSRAKVLANQAAKKVVAQVASKVKKVTASKPVTGKPAEVTLKTGDVAPSFSLLNQDGEKVSLEQFRGKTVVLYFYPKAMTPGCTIQACGLRDNKEKYDAKNVVVLGVSPDEPSALKKFEEKERLNFPLLSDADHKVSEAYGVWGLKKFMGREYLGVNRVTFVIDQNGRVKSVMEGVDTKTHHDDALRLATESASVLAPVVEEGSADTLTTSGL